MDSFNLSKFKRNITNKAFALLVIFLLFSHLSYSQDPSLTIGHVGLCDNSTVLVPVIGDNLLNVGAITLFIDYNPNELLFESVENINPQLSGLMVNNLTDSSRLSIVWSKTTGANFMNTSMMNLKFQVLSLPCTITFLKNNCEIANIAIPPQVIPVNFADGTVFPSLPALNSGPENKTISSQSNALFQVTSSNATGYSWQERKSISSIWTDLTESVTYTGTSTNTLTITSVPASFNQFLYRCILSLNGCQILSPNAILSVDSLAGIDGTALNRSLRIKNSPNPFSESSTLEYSVPEYGFVTIKIMTLSGQVVRTLVNSYQQPGSYRLEDNFVSLPAGIYFCEYSFNGIGGVSLSHWKMIKTTTK